MFGLPPELRIPLVSLLTLLVTAGLKSVANLLGGDFGGKLAAIVAVVVGAVMFLIDGFIAMVPVEYQDAVSAAAGFIVALLGAFGLHYTIKNG
jgi:hypothetical protein